jgi:hypothetical protein
MSASGDTCSTNIRLSCPTRAGRDGTRRGWLVGYDALIVPSVRADGANIVIFVNEVAADAVFERVNVEQIA